MVLKEKNWYLSTKTVVDTQLLNKSFYQYFNSKFYILSTKISNVSRETLYM